MSRTRHGARIGWMVVIIRENQRINHGRRCPMAVLILAARYDTGLPGYVTVTHPYNTSLVSLRYTAWLFCPESTESGGMERWIGAEKAVQA